MDDRQIELPDEAPQPSLKKLGGSFVGLLHGHLELAAIEFQEEKSRGVELMILGGLSLVFGLLLLTSISAAVLIYFWDTHRMPAILIITAVYAVALAISVSKAAQVARQAQSPFKSTLEELARTKERLLP